LRSQRSGPRRSQWLTRPACTTIRGRHCTRAAYAGALGFGAQLWAQLEPLLDAQPGPFLFVGMSRGGSAALELAMRTASEKRKPATALSISPAFVRPATMAPTLTLIGSLEPLVEHAADLLAASPLAAPRALYGRTATPIQALLTGLCSPSSASTTSATCAGRCVTW
jgi:pimeloyl-ACP methyl ester carboxylesterase